jgi:heat-inducible transcriptional repressor
MAITERQKLILDRIIQEYIDSALPVSSQLLEKKYRLGISPATIRIEMQGLTDKGYLYQPHTSAGRIPTDKAYRFFVDDFFEEGFFGKELLDFDEKFLDEISQIEKEIKDSFRFVQILTKKVAELTSDLAVSYLSKERVILKEGWEEMLRKPEFKDSNCFSKFIKMMEDWEGRIEDFETLPEIKVYIGKENPLAKSRDFSAIIAPCNFSKEQEGIIAILGPKRMAYPKNISLIKSLTRHLTEAK